MVNASKARYFPAMTRKERTLLRRWFIAEFDRIMSARDKAEKTYRQERGLRMPSVKQLESAIRMGTEAPCYKRNDIAWDYPGEIYQTEHEMLIPDQIMAILEKEKTKHDNAHKNSKRRKH